MYVVRNLLATADGTGVGFLSCQMTMDPTFCSLLGYCSWTLEQGTPADAEAVLQFTGVNIASQQKTFDMKSASFVPTTVRDTWLPPAVINGGVLPPTLALFMDNVGTDEMLFSANIFLYDIRAREDARFGLLVAARGGV